MILALKVSPVSLKTWRQGPNSYQMSCIEYVLYTPQSMPRGLTKLKFGLGPYQKRLLKRLSAILTEELKCKIMAFIDYYNETMAKVYKWTYNGRPLIA